MNLEVNTRKIKIGAKKAGSYIAFMQHNPSERFEILARGSNTSKAIYVVSVMLDDYFIDEFTIEAMEIGKREPLAILKIELKRNGSENSRKFQGKN